MNDEYSVYGSSYVLGEIWFLIVIKISFSNIFECFEFAKNLSSIYKNV